MRVLQRRHASCAGICILFWLENDYSLATVKELTMRVFDKIKRFAENRRAIRELGTLDDHVLHDLGISRSRIRSAVLGNSRS